MKIILTPRRHAVPVMPGSPPPNAKDEDGITFRRRLVRGLKQRFPQVRVDAIVGKDELLVDVPDSQHELPAAIRAAFDCETGTIADAAPALRPAWRDLPATADVVAASHRRMDYRPTVVAVIRDPMDRILLVRSVKAPLEWMLVQGGIEPGEAPLEALGREIGEEIDVGADFWAPLRYLGCADLDVEPARDDKRGFTKGKRYFSFDVAYRGPEELRLQASELSDYAWVGPELGDPQLLVRLAQVRPAKRRLIVEILIRALR